MLFEDVILQLKRKKTVKNTITALSKEEQKQVSGGYAHKDHTRNTYGGNGGNGPGRNRP